MGLQIQVGVLKMIDGTVVAIAVCEFGNLCSWPDAGLSIMHILVACRLFWCKIWNGGFDHNGRSVGRSCNTNGYGRNPGSFGTALSRGVYVVLRLLLLCGEYRRSIDSYQLSPS